MRSPRAAAYERLARLAPAWPNLPFTERGEGGLADAIVLETVRRWMTLESLVEAAANRPAASIEAAVRAALMGGAAQIVLMDEADHAVVDESVEWAKRVVRPGAGGMVNAVLRRIASWKGERVGIDVSWWRARDLVPLGDGGARCWRGPAFAEDWVTRIAVLTSHAPALIGRWMDRFGIDETARLALHSLAEPPRIVADARGTLRGDPRARPHAEPGFCIWTGSLGELRAVIEAHPELRVQDPGSAAPVARSAELRPRLVVDACAGRGTKTKQLAELHPGADLVAGDIDPVRRRELARSLGHLPNVRVLEPEAILALRGVDLLLLDVPCSNTGVLSRRPEAKYAFSQAVKLASLVRTQHAIAEAHAPLVGPEGRVIHAVCSLEAEELAAANHAIGGALRRTPVAAIDWPDGAPGGDPALHRDGGGSVLF